MKSVYAYDGLDDQELSFPGDCYIRLLRKDIDKKIDGEEWWEGAYENKIGFFPSIFVQEFGKFEKFLDENESDLAGSNDTLRNDINFKDELDKTMESAASLENDKFDNKLLSPTENQQVPH